MNNKNKKNTREQLKNFLIKEGLKNYVSNLSNQPGECLFCGEHHSSIGFLDLVVYHESSGHESKFVFEFCGDCHGKLVDKNTVVNYCLGCFTRSFEKKIGVPENEKFQWDLTCKHCKAKVNTDGIYCDTPKIHLYKILDAELKLMRETTKKQKDD